DDGASTVGAAHLPLLRTAAAAAVEVPALRRRGAPADRLRHREGGRALPPRVPRRRRRGARPRLDAEEGGARAHPRPLPLADDAGPDRHADAEQGAPLPERDADGRAERRLDPRLSRLPLRGEDVLSAD